MLEEFLTHQPFRKRVAGFGLFLDFMRLFEFRSIKNFVIIPKVLFCLTEALMEFIYYYYYYFNIFGLFFSFAR